MTIKDFPTGEYKCVVIDPPWPVRTQQVPVGSGYSKHLPYKLMSVKDISALPVQSTLAERAWVFVWTTQRFLRDTYSLLDAWGLSYRHIMVWHKNVGVQFFNSPMSNAEFVLIGAKGNPKFVGLNYFPACFCAPRRAHSVKPAEFYNTLVRVTEPPRLDIFSRRLIPGFDVWGDEAPTEVLEKSQYLLFGDST